jgi:hypothetical protein
MEARTTGGFTDTSWNCTVTGDAKVNQLVSKQGALSKHLSQTGIITVYLSLR